MDGFERRRQEKKRAIIEAAVELFNQHGFDRVTVAEIAKKAHVAKVSIYNFFESKDNLRREIIKETLDESLNRFVDLIAEEKSFVHKIQEYLEFRIKFLPKYNYQFFFDSIEIDPILRNYFHGYTEKNKQLIMSFIEEGKREGYFSSKISNEAISVYIDMYHSYFLNNRTIISDFENNPELSKEVHLLFLDGLISDRNEVQ